MIFEKNKEPNFIQLSIKNNKIEQEEESFNKSSSIFSETIAGKKLLPIEDNNEENESLSSIIKKNNLVFEEKDVSFIKLYMHLSDKYEIILMILGVISAFGAGVAAPLLCYLFGDIANDFTSVNADESQMDLLKTLIECKNEEEVIQLAGGNEDKAWIYLIFYRQGKELFNKFDDNVNSMVKN